MAPACHFNVHGTPLALSSASRACCSLLRDGFWKHGEDIKRTKKLQQICYTVYLPILVLKILPLLTKKLLPAHLCPVQGPYFTRERFLALWQSLSLTHLAHHPRILLTPQLHPARM